MLDILPWRLIKRGIAATRRRYYTVDWPGDVPSVLVGADPAGLERRLRECEGFEGTPYSYRYEDEAVNLRRPWGLADTYGPRELHVRGRPLDGGLELIAHVEPSRYECKHAHIESEHVDWQAGYEALLGIVSEAIVEERPVE